MVELARESSPPRPVEAFPCVLLATWNAASSTRWQIIAALLPFCHRSEPDWHFREKPIPHKARNSRVASRVPDYFVTLLTYHCGVGRGYGVGRGLGVGTGLGVDVAVAVAVGVGVPGGVVAVAVAVGVADGGGAVAVA